MKVWIEHLLMNLVCNIRNALGQDLDGITKAALRPCVRSYRNYFIWGARSGLVGFSFAYHALLWSVLQFILIWCLFAISFQFYAPLWKWVIKLINLYKNHWANPWAGDDGLQFNKYLELLIKGWIISVIFTFYRYTFTTFTNHYYQTFQEEK